MTDLLSSVGNVFTQCLTWLGELMTTITATPILFVLVIAIPVISFVIGFTRRLLGM